MTSDILREWAGTAFLLVVSLAGIALASAVALAAIFGLYVECMKSWRKLYPNAKR